MAMAMRTFLLCVFIWTSSLLLAGCQSSGKHGQMETYPNLPFPTMGGRQLWADVNWYAGWRVQQNVWTGHCRLLDPENRRRAWGRRPAVEDALFQQQELLAMFDVMGELREQCWWDYDEDTDEEV